MQRMQSTRVISAGLAGFALCAVLAGCGVGTQQGYEPEQPIAFSHAIHAGENKIDCRYCHTGVERSRHAGLPAVGTCMNCHSKVATDKPGVQALQESLRTGKPTEWLKVHRLPDHAFFSHRSHVVSGGVECNACHGPVETMHRMRQESTLTMGWCVDCHRQERAKGRENIVPPLDCSACHQ
jgi:hypothetical protein